MAVQQPQQPFGQQGQAGGAFGEVGCSESLPVVSEAAIPRSYVSQQLSRAVSWLAATGDEQHDPWQQHTSPAQHGAACLAHLAERKPASAKLP